MSFNDDIIVFWANDPTVGKIYYRGYRDISLTWDTTITLAITDATMTANTFITIFQESYSPVGVAYMTLNAPPYTIVLNGVLTGLEATVLSGYLANPDTGLFFVNNMYSMYRYYDFYVSVSTPANPCDVTDVYLTVQDGAIMRFKVRGTNLNVVPAWSIVANATQINLAGNCTWTIVGQQGIGHFFIETRWNFTSTSNLDVYVEAINPSGSSGIISTAPNSFDVVSTLVATIETAVHDIFFGTQAEIHGGVFYEADPANTTIFTGMFQPPDSEFTRVEVYNGTVVSAQDLIIVNGNYSVIFIPYFSLATTQNYTLRLYMKSPYVSGPPANNPILTLYLTANWVPDLNLVTAFLQKVFDIFGMGGAVAAVWGFLGMFGTSIYNFVPLASGANWFLGAMFAIVTYVGSLATIFFNFTSWFFYWVFTMANFISSVVGIVIGIFNGTLAVGGITMGVWTGLGNIWTTFGGANLMMFLPFVILIVWMQSLDSRERTMGINFIVLAVNDFQTVYGLINVLTGFAIFIYSVVVDWVRWLYGYMTAFFTKMFSPI